ncbi:hypothetical protein niasHT_007829 [Heterodera trifolii]|uniref:Hyaluronan/mRNA-binding protein domain-containing protein n=1 Tax=Heterodera trifolii TaxID=157864 RepID=A0ABD2M0A2_9BILA
MEYGVQTHNKFAFLDDDVDVSDPEEALSKKVEEAKKDAVTAALSAKKVTVLPPVPVTKSVAQKENEKPIEPPPAVSDRKRTSDGGGAGGARRAQPRAGGGGRGPPRGTNFRNGPRPPRTSDTANKETETKPKESEDGGGWDNNVGWDNEVSADIEKPKPEENVENNAVEEVKEPEGEVEQVLREKTYEEWKNEQQQKNAEHIHFNTRKPGEGDDQKLYKELIPVKNPNAKEPKHGNEFDESTQHKEKREKPLAIDLSFSDKRSGSGGGFSGFGDRGSGARGDRSRGGGNRGGMRGGPPRNNYVGGGSAAGPSKRQQGGSFMLENEQFPALGAAH